VCGGPTKRILTAAWNGGTMRCEQPPRDHEGSSSLNERPPEVPPVRRDWPAHVRVTWLGNPRPTLLM
jgi:hypothetical protein